jgi:radical SAM superfamily enzyme YgiQ (UPF0313 family)
MAINIQSIAIIEPKNDNLNIYTRYELPRLGSTILATIMHNEGFKSRAYFLSERDIIRREIDADLIGISTITPTAMSAYRLANYYRKKNRIVVMGGPHVSALPEECLEYADYAIVGEGEIGFPMLVKALKIDGDLSQVPGLVWKSPQGVIIKNPSKFTDDLDSIPITDFSLLEMKTKKMGAKVGRPVIPIQTSRGCPFNCNFCSVTATFGKQYRYRSTEHILQELRKYDPSTDSVFFYDDNFTANRNRTKELLHGMIRENLRFPFSTQVRVDIAKDPELLDLMVQAGCNALYIGFESVDPESLKEMNKNQTPKDIEWGIKEIHKRGIHIHGMFIFGFDSDTIQKAKATVKYAINHKIETVQFMILTPLPGTEFFNKMKNEGRLLDRNWEEYDAHHVKYKPLHYTPWQLQIMQIKAHAQFYAIRHVFGRLFRGRVDAFIIGIYANILNHQFVRWELPHLRKLRFIEPEIKSPKIEVYRT